MKTYEVSGNIKDKNGNTQFIRTRIQAENFFQAKAAVESMYNWSMTPMIMEISD